MERLCGKIAFERINPRELINLKKSIENLPLLKEDFRLELVSLTRDLDPNFVSYTAVLTFTYTDQEDLEHSRSWVQAQPQEQAKHI